MFDKNKEYQEHILPLVKEILLYCDEYHIPVFMTFAVSDNGKQTEYATEMISAVAAAEKLKDDQLVKHAAVVSGFEVVPVLGPSAIYDEEEILAEEAANGNMESADGTERLNPEGMVDLDDGF